MEHGRFDSLANAAGLLASQPHSILYRGNGMFRLFVIPVVSFALQYLDNILDAAVGRNSHGEQDLRLRPILDLASLDP